MTLQIIVIGSAPEKHLEKKPQNAVVVLLKTELYLLNQN